MNTWPLKIPARIGSPTVMKVMMAAAWHSRTKRAQLTAWRRASGCPFAVALGVQRDLEGLAQGYPCPTSIRPMAASTGHPH